jgi:hypothetical protein
VIYDWSPNGANRALELLFRARGMLTDRAKVEHSATVRYELGNVSPEDDCDGRCGTPAPQRAAGRRRARSRRHWHGCRRGSCWRRRAACSPTAVRSSTAAACAWLRCDELVISSLTEFEESTAFERWTVEALVPLPARTPHGGRVDAVTGAVTIAVQPAVVRVYAGGLREVPVDLRPLAFGAAWKVLDLMLELAFRNAGTTAPRGELRIARKKVLARQAHGALVPLTTDRDLWRTLTSIYVATIEARHSLVHRLPDVDRNTGTLTGHDRNGQPLVPITAEEQEAFCRAIQRAASAVLAGRISPRERADLAWQLDQLQAIISDLRLAALSSSRRGFCLHQPPSPVVS